jgi:hypothetical protein
VLSVRGGWVRLVHSVIAAPFDASKSALA